MERYPKLINQSDNSTIIINNLLFCIGRSLTCDHIIQSLDVSRFHCIIKKNNDKWILCDRSTNGTIVNSKLYTFNKSTVLRDGDVIKLGSSNVSFVFKSSQESQHSQENHNATPTTKKASCSTTAPLFPEDEVLLEEAASMLVESIEEFSENKTQNDNKDEQVDDETDVEVKSQGSETDNVIQESTSSATVDNNKSEEDGKNKCDNNEPGQNFDIVDDELTCSICSELFIKAVTLNCSHTFCKYCIDTWKANQMKCPICRKQITNVSPTLVLDNFIEKIVNTQSDEAKETRKQLVKQREEMIVNAASSSSANSQHAIIIDDNSGYEDEDSDLSYSSDDHDYDDYYDYGDYRPRRRPYYGGYGSCFICGQPGHWANSCPNK